MHVLCTKVTLFSKMEEITLLVLNYLKCQMALPCIEMGKKATVAFELFKG